MFIFGITTFVADSIGHLRQVENYALGRIVVFENLEYSADSREELIL